VSDDLHLLFDHHPMIIVAVDVDLMTMMSTMSTTMESIAVVVSIVHPVDYSDET
jgi:hypothetical protein